MANDWSLLRAFIVLFLASTTCVTCNIDGEDDRKVYVVYMGAKSNQDVSVQSLHLNILEQVLEDDSISAAESLVYSYARAFSGFAARLTHQQKQKLTGMQGIVSVFESKTLKPHTTRSWDFLGLTGKVPRQPKLESDIVVGMIDTGVWPESKGFSDKGLGPPPKKWRGPCHNITCNNKIIGGRYYNARGYYVTGEGQSPRDVVGHGTHTASTVAGAAVSGASLYGLARGTARGGVPSARIAVYKVCWSFGCDEHDILAAFNDAIADGVDVISASVGGVSGVDYNYDGLAIGSFHAMQAGILTLASAGNAGPDRGTASNVAPWLVSVAASTIDRRIVTKVEIGDHERLTGQSINTFSTEKNFLPLILGRDAAISKNTTWAARKCFVGSLDPKLVKGKIVLCEKITAGTAQMDAGARGVVMVDLDQANIPYAYPLPVTTVDWDTAGRLWEYVNKTRNPLGKILKSEPVLDETAPNVATFSSRGPNLITPDILKPDISAPGVTILAAWSPKGPIVRGDTRSVKYNIISGTSMACPHVTGVAVYIKTFHPTWSPAAIASAIVTTATPMNATLNVDAELSYGAGQINPLKAVNPGLVYDAGEADFVQMLCNQGYNTTSIRLMTGDQSSCSAEKGSVRDLNYPSMAAKVGPKDPFPVRFTRTVTNVGSAGSTYRAVVSASSGIHVSVEPNVLSFHALNQKQKFVVTVSGAELPEGSLVSASVVWSDGFHSVRSPIVVLT